MESIYTCIVCDTTCGSNGLCGDCSAPYQKAWCIGERAGELRRLIDVLKFDYTVAAAGTLAELLHEHISDLPANTVIVPVPTIPAHIRQRGYDHALKIAMHFAKRRKLTVEKPVRRKNISVQRGAGRADRIRQAREAFEIGQPLNPAVPYLVVDDVITTGATLNAMAQILRSAGARTVWVAAVARQPLD